MTRLVALLDSNVVVACLAEGHEHHPASAALLEQGNPKRFAVAAHSYAEAFVTLTRGGANAPFGYAPSRAWLALESLRAATTLVGLTPAQLFEAARRYAASGGTGARLYDALIGEAARVNSIATIVTWNTRHMSGLFTDCLVATPRQFLRAVSAR